MRRIWVPQVVVAAMLLWALNPENPYAYYTLLRWVTCVVFAYLAFRSAAQRHTEWTWVLGASAAIYNPIIPVHLNREIWSILNLAGAAVAATSAFVIKVPSSRIKA